MRFKDCGVVITGAGSGIGRETAFEFAAEGAVVAAGDLDIAMAERTVEEIARKGGRAHAFACDVTKPAQVTAFIDAAAKRLGRLDVLLNSAGIREIQPVLELSHEQFTKVMDVNVTGTFLVSQACLPYLLKAPSPHILTIAPPLDLDPKWFAPHVAYTAAKYAMSLISLGLAAEFAGRIAVNCLWPRTFIATAAIRNVVGGDAAMRQARKPEIMADAARAILIKDKNFSGHFLIDDSFLASEGVTNFERYRVDPTVDLKPDFFVPDTSRPPASLKASR